MNNKGQTLIIFVILIPIIVLMLALVVDVGILTYNTVKTKGIVENAISDYFNESISILETLKLNGINTDNLNITYEDNQVTVSLEYEIEAIFGKIINLQSYTVKVRKTGYLENNKILIE